MFIITVATSSVTDAAELCLGSTEVCLSCNKAGSMSPTSIVCNDAHMSAAQVSSGCCLQICLGLLSCNSSINFLQLILHMPCTKSIHCACCHCIVGKASALCRYLTPPFWVDQQLCLSSSQCQPHRQASLSSRHSSFHSRCSSSHLSLPSPVLTASGRSMMMAQPQCNPRGCRPCPWDQPRPWDWQGPSLREHLLFLKVMLRLDLTWHVLKCYTEYVPIGRITNPLTAGCYERDSLMVHMCDTDHILETLA